MKKIVNIFLISFLCLILVGCENKTTDEELTGIIPTNLSLFNEIKNNNESTVVYIGTPNCPACVTFYPILEAVVEEHNLDVYYIQIDRWSTSDRNAIFQTFEEFQYTPSIYIINNGEQIAELVGGVSEEDLAQFLKENNIIE